MDGTKRVLVTGGTGFIGSHVVNAFVRHGVEVVCLVRKGSDISYLESLGVEFRYGMVEDLASLTEAMCGVGFVVHVAGLARDWGKYEEFYQTNVVGTLNVLRAAETNGINQVIITASNSVYGEEDHPGLKDESSPWESHYPYFADRVFPSSLNYYRDTKMLAKREAVEYSAAKDMDLIVIEPVWVYGEREFNTGFYEYVKTAKSGVPALPGSGRNRFHVVYAGDLAQAYVCAYAKMCAGELTGQQSFLIGNPEAERMERIYGYFCKEAGCNKPWNLPKWVVYPAGFLLELLYTVMRAKEPPLLTRGRVNMFYDSIEYSVERARQVLGFTAVTSLEEGIRRTVNWYREKGLL